ncbi:MAG: Fe(3+) ABC transporter substrate-binding protein [Saprospirales bacterium]|nr:MAG: Fe(3+) ABC transporter substrate-binding protein [Saprospirales bacterium]
MVNKEGKWVFIIALLLGSLGLSSCSDPDRLEVNVYSHRHYPIDREIFESFTAKTGIRVNVVSASADELITRLELEGERSPADLLITVDAGRLHNAKTAGLLQSVESDILMDGIPFRLRDAENYWFAYTYRARAIAYAPDRISPEEILTYESLANPSLNGRVVMRSSENAYNQSLMASVLSHRGEEFSREWCSGLVGNFSRQPRGNDRDQIKAVAAGQGDVTVCNTYYVAKLAESPSAEEREVVNKIRILFPNQDDRGTHINISGAGITRYAPNRQHAVKLIEYLISSEVQEKLSVENHEYPIRGDVKLSPFLEEWGEFKIDTLPLEQLGIHNEQAVRIIDACGWL